MENECRGNGEWPIKKVLKERIYPRMVINLNFLHLLRISRKVYNTCSVGVVELFYQSVLPLPASDPRGPGGMKPLNETNFLKVAP